MQTEKLLKLLKELTKILKSLIAILTCIKQLFFNYNIFGGIYARNKNK